MCGEESGRDCAVSRMVISVVRRAWDRRVIATLLSQALLPSIGSHGVETLDLGADSVQTPHGQSEVRVSCHALSLSATPTGHGPQASSRVSEPVQTTLGKKRERKLASQGP